MSAPQPLPTATSERSAEPTPDTAGAETMKAIVQDEYGTAPEEVLRLAEIARPETAADEILVRVRAASVDRGTWHLMAGLPYPIRLAVFGLRRPKASNPGRSLAGTVECVGQEVTGFEPGDETSDAVKLSSSWREFVCQAAFLVVAWRGNAVVSS
jgi:NADPH:quinone reductase-like Zn-dependent oxidoreductase